MNREKLVVCSDEFGKYMLDASKIVLGSAVVLHVFQKTDYDLTKLVIGAIVAGAALITGMVFKTIKIK